MLLRSILDQIKQNKDLIAIEPDPMSPAYPSQQANRRNAMVAIKELQEQYKQALIGNTLLIVATGDGADDFAATAEGLGTYTASMDAPIDLAVDSTNSDLFVGKQMNQEALSFTIDVLENIISNSGVLGLSLDYVIDSSFVKTKEQYAQFVAGKMTDQDNAVALVLSAMDELSKRAASDEFDQKTFPVLLTTKYPFLAESLDRALKGSSLLPHPVSIVMVGAKNKLPYAYQAKDSSEGSVKKVFSDIKNKVLGTSSKKLKNKQIADTEDSDTAEQGE